MLHPLKKALRARPRALTSAVRLLDSRIHPIRFVDALAVLHRINSQDEFIDWTRGRLRCLLPHGALVCGTGRIVAGVGAVPLAVLNVDVPEDYLSAIRTPDGQYRTPIMQRWLASGEPQLFEAEAPGPQTDPHWLRLFEQSGLRNIAAHGAVDIAGGYASYFSFHRIPGKLGEPQRKMLRFIVPPMHAKLLAITRRHDERMGESKLTERECEILAWVREGKSNQEIALILGISFKTVKNQVANILAKLEVSTRAQAAAKAITMGVIAPPRR